MNRVEGVFFGKLVFEEFADMLSYTCTMRKSCVFIYSCAQTSFLGSKKDKRRVQ